MRPRLIAFPVVLALVLAACSASAAPGWTYAPPTPSPTPGPSGSAAPSGAPSSAAPSGSATGSAAPSAAPSTGASGAPSAAPSGGAGGGVVQLTALNIAFQETELQAPADTPFTIHFVNQDAATPHNVEIKDASGTSKFKGEIFNGVAEKDYSVPALPAGSYQFACSVHPTMTGTLKVGA